MANEHQDGGAHIFRPLFGLVSAAKRAELLDEALSASEKSKQPEQDLAEFLPVFRGDERSRVISRFNDALCSRTNRGPPLSRLINLPSLPLDVNILIFERLGDLMKDGSRTDAIRAVARLAETIATVEGPDGIRSALLGVRTAADSFP